MDDDDAEESKGEVDPAEPKGGGIVGVLALMSGPIRGLVGWGLAG